MSRNLMYDFPTPQQCKALRFITLTTGVLFQGNTFEEARTFIKENLKDAQDFKENKENNLIQNKTKHDLSNKGVKQESSTMDIIFLRA